MSETKPGDECPDCCGKGVDDDYIPHVSNPEHHWCKTCDGEGVVDMDECVQCEETLPVKELDDNRLCAMCRNGVRR